MSLQRVIDGFSGVIDAVAEAVVAVLARLRSTRTVELVEAEDGAFLLQAREAGAPSGQPAFRLDAAGADALPESIAAELRGRDIELVLRAHHFLFRSLELPRRAGEFLAGIVRAQIDRLTPWSPGEAAFGWTSPADLDNERIALTVAATSRMRIEPYLQALKALGARSIVIATPDGAESSAPRIRVFDQMSAGTLGVARVRGVLLAVLVVALTGAVLSVAASGIAGTMLDAELDELNGRIAGQRRALTAGAEQGEGAARRALEQRKQESPATVLVLEALAGLLPDHTYVTEMHIEGDKLQLIGVSPEAPSLIRLMEQSARFTEATFFAPTTRVAQETGERFHIEARIKLPFAATSRSAVR